MMCSSLSSFDPMVSTFSVLIVGKHVVLVLLISLIPVGQFISSSGITFYFKMMLDEILGGMKNSFKKFVGVVLLPVGLFVFILMSNFCGMIPFSFCATSHMSMNLSLSIPLWLGGMVWMCLMSKYFWVSHFVPFGCPLILAPFLVLVEVISSIIRPLSLAIRLMSNMIAGHMILGLIWGSMWEVSLPIFFVMLAISSGILAFEMGVCVIQSYVFTTLTSLYWSESEEN